MCVCVQVWVCDGRPLITSSIELRYVMRALCNASKVRLTFASICRDRGADAWLDLKEK